SDDLALFDIGEQYDAVDIGLASYLHHDIMLERIRIYRNFNCHNHSLWVLSVMMGVNLGNYPYRNQFGHFFFGKGEMAEQGLKYSFHSIHMRDLRVIRPICGQKSTSWK